MLESARLLAVSNFSESHLRKLLDWDQLRVRPSVHQTELHPYLQQKGVVQLCEKEGILLQAYASLGGQDTKDGHWKALEAAGSAGPPGGSQSGQGALVFISVRVIEVGPPEGLGRDPEVVVQNHASLRTSRSDLSCRRMRWPRSTRWIWAA